MPELYVGSLDFSPFFQEILLARIVLYRCPSNLLEGLKVQVSNEPQNIPIYYEYRGDRFVGVIEKCFVGKAILSTHNPLASLLCYRWKGKEGARTGIKREFCLEFQKTCDFLQK